jgi:hypothetical protein
MEGNASPPQHRRGFRRLITSFLGLKRSQTSGPRSPASERSIHDFGMPSNVFLRRSHEFALLNSAPGSLSLDMSNACGKRSGSDSSIADESWHTAMQRATAKLRRKGSRLIGKRFDLGRDNMERRWSKSSSNSLDGRSILGSCPDSAGLPQISQDTSRRSTDLHIIRRANAVSCVPAPLINVHSSNHVDNRSRSASVTSAYPFSAQQALQSRQIWRRSSVADTMSSYEAGLMGPGVHHSEKYSDHIEGGIMDAVTRGELPVPPELTSPVVPPRSLLLSAQRSREKSLKTTAATSEDGLSGSISSTTSPIGFPTTQAQTRRRTRQRRACTNASMSLVESQRLRDRFFNEVVNATPNLESTKLLASQQSKDLENQEPRLFLDVPTLSNASNTSLVSVHSTKSRSSHHLSAPPSPTGTFGHPGKRWSWYEDSNDDINITPHPSANSSLIDLSCGHEESTDTALDNLRRVSINAVHAVTPLECAAKASGDKSMLLSSTAWSPYHTGPVSSLLALSTQLALCPHGKNKRPHSIAVVPHHGFPADANREESVILPPPVDCRRRAVISWHA